MNGIINLSNPLEQSKISMQHAIIYLKHLKNAWVIFFLFRQLMEKGDS